MRPVHPAPSDAGQSQRAVTFRTRSQKLWRETESLTPAAQDINENPGYAGDDRPVSQEESSSVKTTGHVHAASTAPRKCHVKRAVKTRNLANATSANKAGPSKEQHDGARDVVRYRQSPSIPTWLLEPDGEQVNPFLPSPFPHDLVKQQMQNVPEVLAKLASTAALASSYGRTFAHDVMTSISSHPAQLHAVMFTVMVHDRVQQGIATPTATELMVGNEAIRHLNKEISHTDLERALSDSNIWTVMILAYSGRQDKLRCGQSYPRQSFLRELQAIHIFLKMEIVVEHVVGLIKMIGLLGDLRKIRTPGIAAVISFAGLVGAVRGLTHPIFPFISHTTTFVREDGRLATTQHEFDAVANDLGELGNDFWKCWGSLSSAHAYLDLLLDIIQDMCDFTVVVENHASGRWIPRTSPEIIDQRNFVQHKLMSLLSKDELVAQTAVSATNIDAQYESCRLACIIYSFIVVFPVPPVVGPFEGLTERLKIALKSTDWWSFDRRRLRLHTWILVMGAMASIGLPDRPWFLLRVMEAAKACGLHGWKDLRTLLKRFLWHPRTNDFDGLDIWKAVQADSSSGPHQVD